MLLTVSLIELINMGALVCTWVLVVTLLCGVSRGYFASNMRSCSFPGPQYSSCRENIEDLKALLEITQCLKPDATYTCPTCSSTLSEELIIKLVNALIFAATQNCGFNGRGCGGIPIHNNGGIGGNTGVSSTSSNLGGVIGNGNNVISGGGGTANVGGIINGGGNNLGNTGVIGNNDGNPRGSTGGSAGNGGGAVGGNGSGGAENKPMDAPSTSGQSSNDNQLVSVNLGGTQVLGIGLGPNQNSGGPSTKQNSGSASKPDNELLGVDLINQHLGIDLGPNRNTSATTPVSTGGSQTPVVGGTNATTGGVTNGTPGTVTNGAPGAVTNGASSTVTNGVPISNHADSVPSHGENTPISNVNSGNTQNDQSSSDLLNVLSPTTNTIK